MAIKPVKVSQLNGYIKRILQSDPLLGNVSVIGEVSNLKHHSTGHVYFTMKDENSKINCFLASEYLRDLRYELADGIEIIASGYIFLYERGGTYSLNVRDIAVEGLGNLTAAFEKLKQKLSGEGLFDDKYKKPIPYFPNKIAVITSETGAAVRDIIKIIKSRNNIVDILVYPCLVQGPGAAADIAKSIQDVNRLFPETDTIIVGRGGGSMEELWAFNEEIVARSIFASKIPVISAVGHETDFTISDFVADKRAETPTAAAQMAVPDINALKAYVEGEKDSLVHVMERLIKYMELRVASHNIGALSVSLNHRLLYSAMNAEALFKDMGGALDSRLKDWANRLEMAKSGLDALNPKNIMDRGYAAILNGEGKMTGTAGSFLTGDDLTAVMKDGSIQCRVFDVRRNQNGKTREKDEL
ncbi:exodeoxyribonuclease VII large subunit [Anoxybacterium hadale]|uniref:Exodeoxyribonuclease VII large subunit n=1 Tax=Anoxybacterium hadale TaxID=3408580 RepID=A0ACD1A8W2_9FIRM|nr:exodeoxyribonuclease VII large subunit [Clostridiales bacterium]